MGIEKQTCLRCGWSWYPRTPELPRRCANPKCCSPLWNKPKWKNSGPKLWILEITAKRGQKTQLMFRTKKLRDEFLALPEPEREKLYPELVWSDPSAPTLDLFGTKETDELLRQLEVLQGRLKGTGGRKWSQ